MKRILSLLLALTLAFSVFALVSCNKGGDDDSGNAGAGKIETLAGKTPEELYEVSKTKLAEATSYSVSTTQVITMEGITMNQTAISKVDGDNSYVEMTNDTTPITNMKVWYVDGMMYMDTYSGKSKCEYSKEQYMEEYMGADPSESTLLDIPESWFTDVKFEKEGESWVLNFVISAAKYNELLDNLSLNGTISGDVVYKLYFDNNGNMTKLTTAFDMVVSGFTAHCDQVSYITVESVNVTVPADADSYQLTTMP